MSGKKVCVLFSSGLDSTYLVWKNLKEGNEVIPVYMEISNNNNKTIIEKNRINLLIKEFEKEFNINDKRMIHESMCIVNVGINHIGTSIQFKQLPIWLLGCVYIQGYDYDEIQIGYVNNDDMIPYLGDIQNIYKSYEMICDSMCPLVFPLTKMMKKQMASELPKKYLDLIFSCENPKNIGSEKAEIIEYEPCCVCDACRTIINSEYYNTKQFPRKYKERMIEDKIYSLYGDGYKVIDGDGVEYMEKMSTLAPRLEPYQLHIDFEHSNNNNNTVLGYE